MITKMTVRTGLEPGMSHKLMLIKHSSVEKLPTIKQPRMKMALAISVMMARKSQLLRSKRNLKGMMISVTSMRCLLQLLVKLALFLKIKRTLMMTSATSMIHPLFLNPIQAQMIRKKQMMILVTSGTLTRLTKMLINKRLTSIKMLKMTLVTLETLTSRNHRCHLHRILKSKRRTMMMILETSVILISLKPKQLLLKILKSTRKKMTTSAILEISINL